MSIMQQLAEQDLYRQIIKGEAVLAKPAATETQGARRGRPPKNTDVATGADAAPAAEEAQGSAESAE